MNPSPSADGEWQWNQLLDYVEAGLVVPVVGRELLRTEIDGTPQYVPAYLARQFCARARVPWSDDLATEPDPVGVAVQRFLSTTPKGRNWPYTALSQLTRELGRSTPPAALLKLAEMPFQLFVSTTPDTYLERALNTVRFTGREETIVPAYGLGAGIDLPHRLDDVSTMVFPLLGRANPSPDYALTDEDVLEFVHTFQTTGAPRRLFEILRQRHVLLIGNGFSDWLTRFFVRQIRPDRLWTSTHTGLTQFVADRSVTQDPRLTGFLQHPFSDTEVFAVIEAEQFVRELHQRWMKRHAVTPSAPRSFVAIPGSVTKPGGVFLSYADEDHEAAARIKASLDRAGIDVWFDRRDLEAGVDYERKIIRQIAKSYFFIAVISRHSLRAEPRFYRLEWRQAETRAQFVAFDLPYVMPVAIDDVDDQDERLPDFVRKVQWTRATQGDLPSEFVVSLQAAYRKIQRPAARG